MRIYLFALFLLGFGTVYSQSFVVEGKLQNPDKEGLGYATVVLLQAKDSVIAQYAVSDEKGGFKLKGVKKGDFILQVTALGYETFKKPLSVEKNIDLGTLEVKLTNEQLKAFEVEGEHVPIAIKGDTVEYNADAFQTRPNAVVEDLLRQLPGVEVDQNGNVKAQGETVQKVLVDGKEFFGDDPKMATKNLPADAIDKVQVFDKKSEMAEFSGVDDGQRNKTINLQLKEGKKNGYFGKVTGGLGTDERYKGKFNLNRFSKKTQFSALGMANNNNEQGFSFEEYIGFMGGMQNLLSGGGMVEIDAGELGIPMGGMDGNEGINESWAGGINLNHDFSAKTEFSSSYFYSRVQNDLDRQSFRQYFYDLEDYTSNQATIRDSDNSNHRLNLSLKQEIDSTQDVRIRAGFQLNDGNINNTSLLQSFTGASLFENSAETENRSNGNRMKADVSLLYRKRFKKKGRVFVADLKYDNLNNNNDSRINSFNLFRIDTTQVYAEDTLRQFQDRSNTQNSYSGSISWTEPIAKKTYLEFNYSYQQKQNDLVKDFYDLLDPTSAEVFNPQLSSGYLNTYSYHRGGSSLRINRKKTKFLLGLSLQQSILDGKLANQPDSGALQKTFNNLFPRFNWEYNFTNAKRLNFFYSARVTEPRLEQLQPVIDNSDPLNIYQGNPDLQAEYSHTANLSYHGFSQFSFTSIFASLRATYTENKIINGVMINNDLVQLSAPINAKDDYQVNAYLSYDTPIRPLKIKVRLNGDISYNKGYIFVNGAEDQTDRMLSTLGFSFENRKKKIFDARIGVSFRHNNTKYAVTSVLDQTFLRSDYYADLTWNINKSWSVGSSFDYYQYTGDAFVQGQTIPLWKANVSKLFLKDQRGQLKISAFDLLNQNLGFQRNSRLNYIEEANTNALSRYFMVSFTYSLSGFGGQNSGTIHIEESTR